jgi:WD40 repeat protein
LPAEFHFTAGDSAFSPNGRTLIFLGPKNCLVIWDIETWKQTKRLAPGNANYNLVQAFSGDGKVLAVRTEKATVRLLDTATWREIKEIDVQKDNKTNGKLSLSNNGKLVASTEDGNKVWLWNVEKGTTRFLEGHTTDLRCCAVSPDGPLVISGSGTEGSLRRPMTYPAELKFWDAATGKEIFSGSGTQGRIDHVVFSPDSKLIALAADDGTIRIWDVVLRRELFTLKQKGAIDAAAFSADGKWILTIGFFGDVRACEASTGHLEKTVASGIKIVTSASFSPDGRNVLLTSNDDKKMRLLQLTVPQK